MTRKNPLHGTARQNEFKEKVSSQAVECPNHDIWTLRFQENYELKSSHARNFFNQTFRNPSMGLNQVLLSLKSSLNLILSNVLYFVILLKKYSLSFVLATNT